MFGQAVQGKLTYYRKSAPQLRYKSYFFKLITSTHTLFITVYEQVKKIAVKHTMYFLKP